MQAADHQSSSSNLDLRNPGMIAFLYTQTMASHSTSSRYERAVEAEAGNDSSSQHNRKLRVGHLFMSSGARVSQTLRGVLACWEDRFRLVKWLHNFGLSFALEVDGVGYLLPYLPHAVVEKE